MTANLRRCTIVNSTRIRAMREARGPFPAHYRKPTVAPDPEHGRAPPRPCLVRVATRLGRTDNTLTCKSDAEPGSSVTLANAFQNPARSWSPFCSYMPLGPPWLQTGIASCS